MLSLHQLLAEKLYKRRHQGLLRSLATSRFKYDFFSNDYLGFARSTALASLIHRRIEQIKPYNGSTGSRLLSGNDVLTEDLEKKLALIFKSEATLILNSGYSANLAVLSSVPQKDDTILYDELAHACIKDGARLSLANRYSFRHNDLEDLEKKLKKITQGQIFIAVESVYSMDGDQCPLKDLVHLCRNYNANIILDEAHSTGASGENGSGLATLLGVENEIAFRIYTFGKAMGAHGACVASADVAKQYLINFARPFIYTTALPPHSIVTIASAFEYLMMNPGIQKELENKIQLFLTHIKPMTNRVTSTTSIQTAIFPGNERVKQVASTLQSKGFDVRPILSPTVPSGSERLRICIHTYNTDQEIKQLAGELIKQ